MKYKFIPVENNIDKAIAFANTLNNNFITDVQRIKQSEHYIQSLDAVDILQKDGWLIHGVNEEKNKRSKKIKSNFIQLQHPDFNVKHNNGKTEALASLTISNSCDGKSPLNLSLGSFRLVCSNGLIAFDKVAESRIKHTEVNYSNLPQILAQMNNKASKLMKEIVDMKHRKLSPEDIKKFAYTAAKLRFNEDDINLNDILSIQRIEDEGDDLWTVFNRIQENLTGNVTNMKEDIKLNQQLFTLANEFAM